MVSLDLPLVEHVISVCTFCRLISTGAPTTDYLIVTDATDGNDLPQHRESGAFVILVEVAPIVRGHVLVVPKIHTYATALVPLPQRSELASLRRALGLFMSAQFGASSYIAYEHSTALPGDGIPQRVKCAPTEHAHFHVMPNPLGDSALARMLAQAEAEGYHGTPFQGIFTALELAALGGPAATCHAFIQGDTQGERGILYAPPGGALPSQYFRRVLSRTIYSSSAGEGDMRADWRHEVVFATEDVVSDIVRTARALTLFSDGLVATVRSQQRTA